MNVYFRKKMYISYLCGQVSLNKWNVDLIQFSPVTQLCLTLCDPMDCSMPNLPVHHQLLELAQTHVHWVSDAIQPFYPLSFPSSPALAWLHNQKKLKFLFFIAFANHLCQSSLRLKIDSYYLKMYYSLKLIAQHLLVLSFSYKSTHICLKSSGTSSLILWKVSFVAGLLGLTDRKRSIVTISLYVASQAAYSIT